MLANIPPPILLAHLLNEPIGVCHYLVVGALLFSCGVVCMMAKRNALGVLMGVELALGGAGINFVALSSPMLSENPPLPIDGQLITLFVIVLAAAEAAVALAITLNFYNSYNSVDVDRAERLHG